MKEVFWMIVEQSFSLLAEQSPAFYLQSLLFTTARRPCEDSWGKELVHIQTLVMAKAQPVCISERYFSQAKDPCHWEPAGWNAAVNVQNRESGWQEEVLKTTGWAQFLVSNWQIRC